MSIYLHPFPCKSPPATIWRHYPVALFTIVAWMSLAQSMCGKKAVHLRDLVTSLVKLTR